jgi:hypothetical protein
MRMLDLLSADTVKIRKPSWSEGEFIELPGTDPNGFRENRGRYVTGAQGIYLDFSKLDDGQDDWTIIEPEPNDFGLNFLNQSLIGDSGSFVLPFGFDQYKGRTLDSIASTPEGLLYLDSLLALEWVWPETKAIINAYLSNPSIQNELNYLI